VKEASANKNSDDSKRLVTWEHASMQDPVRGLGLGTYERSSLVRMRFSIHLVHTTTLTMNTYLPLLVWFVVRGRL
jgi:hypothetical protein